MLINVIFEKEIIKSLKFPTQFVKIPRMTAKRFKTAGNSKKPEKKARIIILLKQLNKFLWFLGADRNF